MSVKITKKRKIQAWIDETVKLINTTLMGKEVPIDITKLPLQLKERITISTVERPTFSPLHSILSQKQTEQLKKILGR